MSDNDFIVCRAPADELFWVKFLDHLSGLHKHELGFLPRQAYENAIELNRVFLCFENGEPCGYLIHGVPKLETKIFQVVVADDSRRIEHGTALVEAARMVADQGHAHYLSCHVAEDLDALKFWKAIGLEIVGKRCRRKDLGREQFKFIEERPGKALAKIALQKQLSESKLTKLHALLTAHNPSLHTVNFQRKQVTGHQIIL